MLLRKGAGILCLLCSLLSNAPAQRAEDGRRSSERIILIVPMVGAGTWEDPKRPLLVSTPSVDSGVMNWSWQASDDGRHAIVEIGARDRRVFEAHKKDARVIKSFERGKVSREQVDSDVKRFSKDYDLESRGNRDRNPGQRVEGVIQ